VALRRAFHSYDSTFAAPVSIIFFPATCKKTGDTREQHQVSLNFHMQGGLLNNHFSFFGVASSKAKICFYAMVRVPTNNI